MSNFCARYLGSVLLLWFTSISCLSWAQKAKPSEYQVKAAYLSNFGRFVEWPAEVTAGDAPFYVCVLGQDSFGPFLDAALSGEKIGRATLLPKRLSRVEDGADCRLLFISASEDTRLAPILAGVGKSVLTVSDMPGFSQRGGMIQFVVEGNRVRFEINLAAAQHAGLILGSDLLKVATAVRRGL